MWWLFGSHKSDVAASLADMKKEILAETQRIIRAEVAALAVGVNPVAGEPATQGAAPLEKSPAVRGRAFADRLMLDIGASSATTQARVPNQLEAFFDAHTEGPGIWKWRHYFDIYHRHFAKFVGRKPTILEIGVFSGGSLLMWQDYFGAGCKIYGVDMIKECRQFESDSVRILIGDQGDREFWRRFKAEVPPIDIIIDDGSHAAEHQIVTIEEMLPHLRPGGVYLCEDIYERAFDDFVDGFCGRLNTMGPPLPGIADYHQGMTVSNVQRSISAIHRYPLVTVVERTEGPVDKLTAPQRGTQWLWDYW